MASASASAASSGLRQAFDHLRAAAPKSRRHRSGSKSCHGNGVGDCPVGEKPDGHHTRPLGARRARGLSVKAVGRSREIVYKLAPGHFGTRDDGPPSRVCGFESSSIRPRGFGAGERFYRPTGSLPEPIACDKSPFCRSSERTAFCAQSTLPKHEITGHRGLARQ